MYNFSQRLDPLIKIKNETKALLEWQKPISTLLFGFALTFAVLYPKLSIIFGSLSLIFGKHHFIRLLNNYQVR